MLVQPRFHWQSSQWHLATIVAIGFWMSSSLLLDFLVMPSLYWSGMMEQAGFATAGYSLFSIFNRLEILCGVVILCGFLLKQKLPQIEREAFFRNIPLAAMGVAIALIFTYILSPQMSALGLNLQGSEVTSIPPAMGQMHLLYWSLETAKLMILGVLLRRSLRLSFGD